MRKLVYTLQKNLLYNLLRYPFQVFYVPAHMKARNTCKPYTSGRVDRKKLSQPLRKKKTNILMKVGYEKNRVIRYYRFNGFGS